MRRFWNGAGVIAGGAIGTAAAILILYAASELTGYDLLWRLKPPKLVDSQSERAAR